MKVTLRSSSTILALKTPDGSIPVRVWQGQTENGIPVLAYVVEIRSIQPNIDWLLKEEQGDEQTHTHIDLAPEILALLPG